MLTGNEVGRVVHSARGGRACCARSAATTGGADEGVLEGRSSMMGLRAL